jgi:hypothetical protein
VTILDVVQGSPEWEQARLGIPTASRFGDIITPKTLKLSKSSAVYRNQLLAEWLLGYPIEWTPQTAWMERGTALEPEARAFYAMEYDVEVQSVGFVLRDDERVGGSPDGLVGDDGGLEIKCPAIQTQIAYLLNPDALVDAYRCQVQGNAYLTGRAWWDILSYHPELPHVRVRIERDEQFITALDACLAEFLADLDEARTVLEPHRLVGVPA